MVHRQGVDDVVEGVGGGGYGGLVGADEVRVGAEVVDGLATLPVGRADDGDVVAEGLSELDAHVADAAQAEDAAPEAADREAEVLQRAVDRDAGAEERRRLLRGQARRNLNQESGGKRPNT